MEPLPKVVILLLLKIPLIGLGLFNQYLLAYVAWLLLPLLSLLLYKT